MQQKDYTYEFSEKRDEDVITVSLNLYVITLERLQSDLNGFYREIAQHFKIATFKSFKG